jgi:hypothetical protein
MDGVAVWTDAVEAEEDGVTGSSPDGAGDVAPATEGGAAVAEEDGRGEVGDESEAEEERRGDIAKRRGDGGSMWTWRFAAARSKLVALERRCGICANQPRGPSR